MAMFDGLVLTDVGKELIAKVTADKKPLEFKNIQIGDGQLSKSTDKRTVTELVNKLYDIEIRNIRKKENDIVSISFELTNQNYDDSFIWREVGIIAIDPDTKSDILYCYGNAGDNGEYIPAKGGSDILEKYINLDLIIDNAFEVSAIIDESLNFVTRKEWEEGGQGTSDYSKLENKPHINSIELDGNKTASELGLSAEILYIPVMISSSSWSLEDSIQLYKSSIISDKIDRNCIVNISMDLDNQTKIADGYTESKNGSVEIYTSQQPSEDITMNLIVIKAKNEVV